MAGFSSTGRAALETVTSMRQQEPHRNQENCHKLVARFGSLESIIQSLMEATPHSAQEVPIVLASMTRVKAALREAADLTNRAGNMGELAAFVKGPMLREEFALVSSWLGDAVQGLENVLSVVPKCEPLKHKVESLATGLKAIEYKDGLGEQQKRQYDGMRDIALQINNGTIDRGKGMEKLSDVMEGEPGTMESEDVESFLDEVAAGIYRARQKGNRQEEDLLEAIQAAVCGHLLRQNHLEVPPDFLCPITLQIMEKPTMVVETGHTYDRDAIAEWFGRGRMTSPDTGVVLKSTATVENRHVQRMIDEWIQEHGPISGFGWGKKGRPRREKAPPRPKGGLKAKGQPPSPNNTKTSLKLNHLAPWFSEATLRSLFGKYGTITYCRVKDGNQLGGNRHGFVEFASLDQARAAIAGMNGYPMGEVKMEVRFAKKN